MPQLSAARAVLASASPRRQTLLLQIGVTPEIRPADVDETIPPGTDPAAAVSALALAKARAVLESGQAEGADLVIAADTVVVLDGDILGKPADAEGAKAMLKRLAGRTHSVYTGFTVLDPARPEGAHVESVRSKVHLAALTPAAIAAYVETGEPLDKAGSYAIQGLGSAFVERVEGCYTNIVGLPLPALVAACRGLGWALF